MRQLSFEDVVRPARDVVETVVHTAGPAANAVVSEFESRVGGVLSEFGLDADSIEALAESTRSALAALLAMKRDLSGGLLRLQELRARVEELSLQPLNVLWRGESVALVRSLWRCQDEMHTAARTAVEHLRDLLATMEPADAELVRSQLLLVDPAFANWLR